MFLFSIYARLEWLSFETMHQTGKRKESEANEREREKKKEMCTKDAHLPLSLFQNQANPLAHHHYRLTGTRRASVPYFQYICVHRSMRRKKKKKNRPHVYRLSLPRCRERERKRHTDLIEKWGKKKMINIFVEKKKEHLLCSSRSKGQILQIHQTRARRFLLMIFDIIHLFHDVIQRKFFLLFLETFDLGLIKYHGLSLESFEHAVWCNNDETKSAAGLNGGNERAQGTPKWKHSR